MLKIFTATRVNTVLIVTLVVLSFLTIIWHNKNRLLYKKNQSTQRDYQNIMSKQKQLLIERSEQMSGSKIKIKAIKILHMQHPKKIRVLSL
jgi:cell division protein FtsL